MATGLGRTILPQPVDMRYISKIDFKQKGVEYQHMPTGCIQVIKIWCNQRVKRFRRRVLIFEVIAFVAPVNSGKSVCESGTSRGPVRALSQGAKSGH